MKRKVFILPETENIDVLGIEGDDLLELRLSLYFICDTGYYWGATVEYHA